MPSIAWPGHVPGVRRAPPCRGRSGVGIAVIDAVTNAFERFAERAQHEHAGRHRQAFFGKRGQLCNRVALAEKMPAQVRGYNFDLFDRGVGAGKTFYLVGDYFAVFNFHLIRDWSP